MNNKIIKAGIAGGAGYTGGEMVRILLRHPNVQIEFVHSRSNAGEPVHTVHTDLIGDTDLRFSSGLNDHIDALFLCLGHGESKAFLQEHNVANNVVVIDLSQDFRLQKDAACLNREFVYGLPEYNRANIMAAKNIANPGCFATAIQLGILPLAKAGILGEVHTTGITGATGAGQTLQASSHFSWRHDNIEAYNTLTHRHINEIMQTIGLLQPEHKPLNFIPWRGDFTRGIYVSSVTRCALSLEEVYDLYRSYYDGHPFTHVSAGMINMKQVVNTNKCLLHIEKADDNLVIHSAIDNLLKGASGQAVQNMNILFGFPEDAGLKLKAISF